MTKKEGKIAARAQANRKRGEAAVEELARVRDLVATSRARFACVDVEAWERATGTVTEIGLAVWRDAGSGEHWTFTHLIIEEHVEKCNGRFVEDNKHNFIFGTSLVVSMDEATAIAREILCSADFIVGHAVKGDVKWLRSLGVTLNLDGGRLIDTQRIAAGADFACRLASAEMGDAAGASAVPITWSLKRLIFHMQRIYAGDAAPGWSDLVASDARHPIPKAQRKKHSGDLHLHNGANDAAWTMAVMLSLCNRDAEWLRPDGGGPRHSCAQRAAPGNGKAVDRRRSRSGVSARGEGTVAGSAASGETARLCAASVGRRWGSSDVVIYSSLPGGLPQRTASVGSESREAELRSAPASAPAVAPPVAPAVAPPAAPATSDALLVSVCFDFRDTGLCRYGAGCKYSHDAAALEASRIGDGRAAGSRRRRGRRNRRRRNQGNAGGGGETAAGAP